MRTRGSERRHVGLQGWRGAGAAETELPASQGQGVKGPPSSPHTGTAPTSPPRSHGGRGCFVQDEPGLCRPGSSAGKRAIRSGSKPPGGHPRRRWNRKGAGRPLGTDRVLRPCPRVPLPTSRVHVRGSWRDDVPSTGSRSSRSSDAGASASDHARTCAPLAGRGRLSAMSSSVRFPEQSCF